MCLNAPMTKPQSRQVKSVVGAAAVLRHLAQPGGAVGVNAIARATGLGPSSCFNILKTLAAEQLVSFDPSEKSYALGPLLIRLARRALASPTTISAMRPLLDRFARRGLATGIWEVNGEERLILSAFRESDAATRIHMSVGQRLPLLAGAMGRCIAAAGDLPVKALRSRFNEVRWERRPDFALYLEQVEAAGARGWAVDEGAFIRGIVTVAAPVRDGEEIRFCISNSMFAGQASSEELDELGAATARAARDASTLLFG
jgi:DNA-binding IclR family transcriptional regulator